MRRCRGSPLLAFSGGLEPVAGWPHMHWFSGEGITSRPPRPDQEVTCPPPPAHHLCGLSSVQSPPSSLCPAPSGSAGFLGPAPGRTRLVEMGELGCAGGRAPGAKGACGGPGTSLWGVEHRGCPRGEAGRASCGQVTVNSPNNRRRGVAFFLGVWSRHDEEERGEILHWVHFQPNSVNVYYRHSAGLWE